MTQQATLRYPDSLRSPEVLTPALSPGLVRELALRLAAQRDFRVAQLAQLDRVGGPGPWGSTDREVRDSLATGARAALRDVHAALARIEQRRYGRCTGCGARLDVERLRLVPQTARCTACLQFAPR